MKLRVKFDGQSYRIDLGDRSTSSLTLEDLIQSVANSLHLNVRDFNLSLNRSDILSDNNTLLSDFGIVAGDLIYALRSEETDNISANDNAHQRSQPLSTRSPIATSSATNSFAQPLNQDNESNSKHIAGASSMPSEERLGRNEASSQSGSSQNTGENLGEEDSMAHSEVNRYLLEPLAVRESTAGQVPALLKQLYSTSAWTNKNEALWVVLHALMIESGFFPSEHEDHGSMPDGWKQQGFYSCNYDYMIRPDIVLQGMLIGVTIGSSMSVHGISKGDSFKTENLQLKAEHFVRTLSTDAPSSYRALDHLSRQFKDTVCLRLMNRLTISAGLEEEQGLMALPCELRIRLMSYLDAGSVCRLGATCSHWNAIYKDPIIWRRLCLQHFIEVSPDCSSRKNWYECYKEKYIAQKSAEEERRRRSLLFSEDFHPLRPFPAPPAFGLGGRQPFFPHVIGGDYDLNPEFASGLPQPMGRGFGGVGPNLGPRLAPTARPDFFHSRGPNLPGQSRRGRANLSGNPFFHF